jgi:hypothetical protein
MSDVVDPLARSLLKAIIKGRKRMLRNALIALYIFTVLAISAVSRAEFEKIPDFNLVFKHPVGPVKSATTVDPLPSSVGAGHNLMNTNEVSK